MRKLLFLTSNAILFVLICSFLLSAQIVINEFSASNLNQYTDNNGKYEDWIELYNASGSSFSLNGYYLSDDSINNKQWQFSSSATIAGNGFLRVWASGRNITGTQNHTNFKLKQTKNSGEYVVLSDPSGTIVDIIKILKKTQLGHSYGRTTNGAGTWSIFTTPTPNASNNTSTAYTRYADRPDFSDTAGFYSSPVTVTITSTESGADIHYTLDGSVPTVASTLYTSPVIISSTKVLKAITISSDVDVLPSFIEFSTFFINEDHTLPVVSITGTQLSQLANGNETLKPIGSFEYFNLNKSRSAKTYGEFNSHGQDSWVLSQRSLDFVSRDEMGYNHSIEEQLFKESSRKDFQRVILRASGDDNYPADYNPDNVGSAHIRDAYVHMLAKKGGLNLDVRTAAKSIVYLNAQYWGVYDLREVPDDHDYTDYYYGQGKYEIQYILTWGSTWAEYGGNQALTDWANLYNYILNNSMAVQSNYDYVAGQLDVTSLTDYVLVNMFSVCSDWLNYNTGWWRGLNPSGTHQKWGYILWDNDATFGHYINYTDIPNTAYNALPCDPEALYLQSWSDPEGHTHIIERLRQNPGFNQYYITRQLDLWNTVFSCDNMLGQLDSIITLLAPEMDRHSSRWGGDYNEWEANVQNLRDYISNRCIALTNGFINCYSLNGPYNLTLNSDTAGTGIKLNSMTINNFPWTGNYFGGVEMKLEAITNGNQFINWTSSNNSVIDPNAASTVISVNLSADETITSHYNLVSVNEKNMEGTMVTAYPTVFDETTTVEFTLEKSLPVSIKLYSLLGKEVAEIVSPKQNFRQGKYSFNINFSKTTLPSGIYLLGFRAGDFRQNIKLVYSTK